MTRFNVGEMSVRSPTFGWSQCRAPGFSLTFTCVSSWPTMRSTFSTIFLLLVVISVVMSLGVPNPLSFQPSSNGFLLASSSDSFALPILLDSSDPEAVHIAAKAFAGDLAKVTGVEPEVHMDSLPGAIKQAIIVCTAASKLASSLRWGRKANAQQGAQVPLSSSEASPDLRAQVEGKWEAYEGAVISEPMEGVEEALVLIGSDRASIS